MSTAVAVPTALQRCLNSPYLAVDESMRQRVGEERSRATQFYAEAEASFAEGDEATGLKQAWGAIYHAARALVYKAGYRVEQLRCMEIALQASYPSISDDDIRDLRRAQELVGPPPAALARAKQFMDKAAAL
jgi:hypothetical protein